MGEDTLDRVHRDLKIVSALREGDKIYVADGNLRVLHPASYNFLWRWLRGDNRIKSLAMIQSTMTDALALAEHAIERVVHRSSSAGKSTHPCRDPGDHALESTVRRLFRELESALVGLKYLRVTYNGDHTITANIDVLREGVVERLDSIQKWLWEATGGSSSGRFGGGNAFQSPSPSSLASLEASSFAGCILLSEDDLRA